MNRLSWVKTGFLTLTLLASSCALAGKSIPLSVINIDGLHATESGIIYAAEGFTGDKVFAITQDGQTFTFASGLAGPIDMANDSQGNLYVSNFNNATVSKIDPDGVVTTFAEVLPGPAGVVVDSADNVYVSHYGVGNGDGDTVLKITPEGQVSTFAQGDFLFAPVATAIDDDGYIYVANFNDGKVIQISPNGMQTLLATIDAPDGYAIGHLDFANNKLFATGIASQAIITIRKNGKVRMRTRKIDEGRFPNGLTYDPVSHAILFTYSFSQVAELEKIRLKSH